MTHLVSECRSGGQSVTSFFLILFSLIRPSWPGQSQSQIFFLLIFFSLNFGFLQFFLDFYWIFWIFLNYPILEIRIVGLYPSVRLFVMLTVAPLWILKQGELESSGQLLFSSNGDTKI